MLENEIVYTQTFVIKYYYRPIYYNYFFIGAN